MERATVPCNHAQKFLVGLLEHPVFLVDAGDDPDGTVAALERDQEQVAGLVAEFAVPFRVKGVIFGDVGHDERLTRANHLSCNQLVLRKAEFLDAIRRNRIVIGRAQEEEFVAFFIQQGHQGAFGSDQPFDFAADIVQEVLQVRIGGEGHADAEEGFVVSGEALSPG